LLFGQTLIKIDVLERLVQVLRFQENYYPNNISIDEVYGRTTFGSDTINYCPDEPVADFSAVSNRSNLIPKLLVFLLIYHKKRYGVNEIIQYFVNKIRSSLKIKDFEKTKTGAIRCFTNTRFAAATLREYGFIRDTKKYRYKTWELTFTGIIVATALVKNQDWNISGIEVDSKKVFHQMYDAMNIITDFHAVYTLLKSLCGQNINNFSTFENILKYSEKIFGKFAQEVYIKNAPCDLSRKKTTELLQNIENHPQMEQFYTELSQCIAIEAFLSTINKGSLLENTI
jgi:hypothetical protein